jgi:hypothetical protein
MARNEVHHHHHHHYHHHQRTNVKVKNAVIVRLTVIIDQVGGTDIENLHQGQSRARRVRRKKPMIIHHHIQSRSTEKGNTLNH